MDTSDTYGSSPGRPAWLRRDFPLPPDSLVTLVGTTAGGLSSAFPEFQACQTAGHRQRALQFVGSALIEAVGKFALFEEFRIRTDDVLSLTWDRRKPSAIATLTHEHIDEAHLKRGGGETAKETASRSEKAFMSLLGAYALTGLLSSVEESLRASMIAALAKTHGLRQGVPNVAGERDPKTELQEVTQRRRVLPRYEMLREEGPDHAKTFFVQVIAPGIVQANGEGRSKKQAELDAARQALISLRRTHPMLFVVSRPKPIPRSSLPFPKIDDPVLRSLCHSQELLAGALTHRSARDQYPGELPTGLSTLGAIVARLILSMGLTEALWDSPDLAFVTQIITGWHAEESLQKLFGQFQLRRWLRLGRNQAHDVTQEMARDTVQALLGATILDARSIDKGISRWAALHTAQFDFSALGARADQLLMADAKTRLQEITVMWGAVPEYTLVKSAGPDNARHFETAVRSSGGNTFAKSSPWLRGGTSRSLGGAQQQSASALLRVLRAIVVGGIQQGRALFRAESPATVHLCNYLLIAVVTANIRATTTQRSQLRRAGLSLVEELAAVSDDLNLRLSEIDNAARTLGVLWEQSAYDWVRSIVQESRTSRTLRHTLITFFKRLDDLRPDTWARMADEVYPKSLLSLARILKLVGDLATTIDPTDICSRIAAAHSIPCEWSGDAQGWTTICMESFVTRMLELIMAACEPVQRILIDGDAKRITVESSRPSIDAEPARLFEDHDEVLRIAGGVVRFEVGPRECTAQFSAAPQPGLSRRFLETQLDDLIHLHHFAAPLHDLKNRLVAMDLMARQATLDTHRRFHHLAGLEQELQTTRGAVSALLGRINAVRAPSLHPLALGEFFGRYRQHALMQLPATIDFAATGDAELGHLEFLVDEELLRDGLDNLVKNAREALGDDPGRIHLEWLADREQGLLLISITDNGPGMSSDALSKILREQATTKWKAGGSGLGLASVRRTIRLHGGSMSITSETGSGTRIYLEVPLVSPAHTEVQHDALTASES